MDIRTRLFQSDCPRLYKLGREFEKFTNLWQSRNKKKLKNKKAWPKRMRAFLVLSAFSVKCGEPLLIFSSVVKERGDLSVLFVKRLFKREEGQCIR